MTYFFTGLIILLTLIIYLLVHIIRDQDKAESKLLKIIQNSYRRQDILKAEYDAMHGAYDSAVDEINELGDTILLLEAELQSQGVEVRYEEGLN